MQLLTQHIIDYLIHVEGMTRPYAIKCITLGAISSKEYKKICKYYADKNSSR